MHIRSLAVSILVVAGCASNRSSTPAPSSPAAPAPTPIVAVGPQYGTTHVYLNAADTERFATAFVATFGGHSTTPAIVTLTATPSSTSSQLLQTPVGDVSLFGYRTGIPYPMGAERNGYLVTDMDAAIRAARTAGADVLVEPYGDFKGKDAMVQWPGGVNLQFYWHTTPPTYDAFERIPENRVYLSADRVDAFVRSFVAFSHGNIVSDDAHAPGIEIGRPTDTFRRIRIESTFGKMVVLVNDGHMPYPFGRDNTGYEVSNLGDTLGKAKQAGANVLVDTFHSGDRDAAIIEFPGGYIAEIHAHSGGASPAP